MRAEVHGVVGAQGDLWGQVTVHAGRGGLTTGSVSESVRQQRMEALAVGWTVQEK